MSPLHGTLLWYVSAVGSLLRYVSLDGPLLRYICAPWYPTIVCLHSMISRYGVSAPWYSTMESLYFVVPHYGVSPLHGPCYGMSPLHSSPLLYLHFIVPRLKYVSAPWYSAMMSSLHGTLLWFVFAPCYPTVVYLLSMVPHYRMSLLRGTNYGTSSFHSTLLQYVSTLESPTMLFPPHGPPLLYVSCSLVPCYGMLRRCDV